MNRLPLPGKLLASFALAILALIQIALFADILSKLPISYDSATRLTIFSEHDRGFRDFLRQHLLLALAAASCTVCLVGWLEWKVKLTVLHKRIVWIGVALSALLAALTYPMTSEDIFSYIAFGRKLGFLGLSPYATTLAQQVADPVISQMPVDFIDLPAIYGPVAILCFAGLNLVSRQDPLILLVTYKIFFFIVYAGSFFLSREFVNRTGVKLPLASLFAFYGNPCVIYMLLIEGHVDGLAIGTLLLAFVALYHCRYAGFGLALGALCCIKITMLPVVPLFSFQILRETRKIVSISAIGFFSVVVLCYSLFDGGELRAVFSVATQVDLSNFGPVPKLLERVLKTTAMSAWLDDRHGLTELTRKISTGLLLLALFGIYLIQWLMGSRQTLLVAVGCSLMVSAVCLNWFQPWYLLWGFPLLLFSPLGVLLRLSIVATTSLLIMFYSLGNVYQASSLFAICVFMMAVVGLISRFTRFKAR